MGDGEAEPEEGDLLELLFGDAANIMRKPGKEDCRIEIALMVSDKDVGFSRIDILESADGDPGAGGVDEDPHADPGKRVDKVINPEEGPDEQAAKDDRNPDYKHQHGADQKHKEVV